LYVGEQVAKFVEENKKCKSGVCTTHWIASRTIGFNFSSK